MRNDQRPKIAGALRALHDGQESIWITLNRKRLLLALPDGKWLAQGVGLALIATRRGYRRVHLTGRMADNGGVNISKRGVIKARPFRTEDDYFEPITEKRIRAIILEEHETVGWDGTK